MLGAHEPNPSIAGRVRGLGSAFELFAGGVGGTGSEVGSDSAGPLHQGACHRAPYLTAALGERLLVGGDGGARLGGGPGTDQCGGRIQALAGRRALAALAGATNAERGAFAAAGAGSEVAHGGRDHGLRAGGHGRRLEGSLRPECGRFAVRLLCLDGHPARGGKPSGAYPWWRGTF